MTNKRNGTLYVGVTMDLLQRVYQHKEGLLDGFTKRYGCNLLAYADLLQLLENNKKYFASY